MDSRRQTHDQLSARLAALSDDDLDTLLAAAAWRRSLHGSQSAVLDLDDAKVFVKQIALTDPERAAGASTANLFGLPLFYQYGVGSAGFGAQRELAAYRKASAWTLSGDCPHFPLLHHWRELPLQPRPPLAPERQAWLDRAPAYWDGSEAVRARLDALASTSRAIVLFLEHIPETLSAWLESRLSGEPPDPATEAAILRFHAQLNGAAGFMNTHGMLHFDLHAHNLLTDGQRLYVTDFGLAICDDFDLSPAERGFVETHRLYDRHYISWLFGVRLAPKESPPALTPALRELADRCTPVAETMGAFFKALSSVSKTTPYPATALAAVENP